MGKRIGILGGGQLAMFLAEAGHALGQHVHGLTFNFLRLLLDRRRLEVLREFPAAFHDRLLRELQAGATGITLTAR